MKNSWPIQINNLQKISKHLTKNKDHRKEISQLDKSMNQQQYNYCTKTNQKNLQLLAQPWKLKAFWKSLQQIANLKVNVSYRARQGMIKARIAGARRGYSIRILKHFIHHQDRSLDRIYSWMVFELKFIYPYFIFYYKEFYYL